MQGEHKFQSPEGGSLGLQEQRRKFCLPEPQCFSPPKGAA